MPFEIKAAWEGPTKNGSDKALYLSLPSSKGEGEYLIGISLQKDHLIIAHECHASKFNRDCWHVEAAFAASQKWLWWKDLSIMNVIRINKKIRLHPDWEQVPIPGEPIDFGFSKEETAHAS